MSKEEEARKLGTLLAEWEENERQHRLAVGVAKNIAHRLRVVADCLELQPEKLRFNNEEVPLMFGGGEIITDTQGIDKGDLVSVRASLWAILKHQTFLREQLASLGVHK